jgi:hypothetical protein
MKPYWSISEACVWGSTLDLDAVEAVNGGNPDGVHWLMPETPPDAYSDHVMAWQCYLREGMPSVWEAFTQLRQLCGDGLLTMLGVARDVGDFEPVPATAWAGLTIHHDEARGGFVAEIPRDLGNPDARWWTRLRLRSADVQRIWPPIEATLAAQPSTKRTAGAKATKREVAIAWARKAFPNGIIPPTMKNETLVADLRTATGIGMSEKTLRRALLAMGQNSDK